MTTLSMQDQQAVNEAVGAALVSGVEAKQPTLDVDPKKIFCENWATVRAVLEALASIVPAPAKAIILLVISIGDGVKKAICD